MDKTKISFTLYNFENPDTDIFAGPEGSIVFYGFGFPIKNDKALLLPRPTDGVAIYSGAGIIPKIEPKRYPTREPISQDVFRDEKSGPLPDKHYFTCPLPENVGAIIITSLCVNDNEIQNVIVSGKAITFNRLGRSVEINCDDLPDDERFTLVAEWSYTALHLWLSWVGDDDEEKVLENKIEFPIALYPDLFLQMMLGADERHAANVKLPESFYVQPKDDIASHLLRLRIFVNELAEMSSLFDKRLGTVKDQENKVFEELGWPAPVFSIRQLAGEMTDIQLNLYFKSFLFIARQAIEKLFRLLYLAKIHFEPQKVKNSICDGSKPENFMKLVQNIIDKKYEYDAELLYLIKDNIHLLVTLRALRNNLKVQGTYNVILQNGKASVIMHILNKDKQDKGYLLFIASPLTEQISELMVKINPEIMKETISFLSKFGQEFENKLQKFDPHLPHEMPAQPFGG